MAGTLARLTRLLIPGSELHCAIPAWMNERATTEHITQLTP